MATYQTSADFFYYELLHLNHYIEDGQQLLFLLDSHMNNMVLHTEYQFWEACSEGLRNNYIPKSHSSDRACTTFSMVIALAEIQALLIGTGLLFSYSFCKTIPYIFYFT